VSVFRSSGSWWQGWYGKFYPLGKTGWVKLGKTLPIYAEILIYYDCGYNFMLFKIKR